MRFLLAAALAVTFTVPSFAQVQVFGGNAPRRATTKIFYSEKLTSMLCIQYGQPEWKDEYNQMVDKLKGKNLRLGKDFWTTFNTTHRVVFKGDLKLDAGQYYLGLHCDDAGKFHLIVLNSAKADKAGYTPFQPDAWKPDLVVPLEKSTDEKKSEKMQIILGGEKATLRFRVRWGNHVLGTSVRVPDVFKAMQGGEKKKD